jgi:hypothetical protein
VVSALSVGVDVVSGVFVGVETEKVGVEVHSGASVGAMRICDSSDVEVAQPAQNVVITRRRMPMPTTSFGLALRFFMVDPFPFVSCSQFNPS